MIPTFNNKLTDAAFDQRDGAAMATHARTLLLRTLDQNLLNADQLRQVLAAAAYWQRRSALAYTDARSIIE